MCCIHRPTQTMEGKPLSMVGGPTHLSHLGSFSALSRGPLEPPKISKPWSLSCLRPAPPLKPSAALGYKEVGGWRPHLATAETPTPSLYDSYLSQPACPRPLPAHVCSQFKSNLHLYSLISLVVLFSVVDIHIFRLLCKKSNLEFILMGDWLILNDLEKLTVR